jgi:hypothetical protein
MAFAYGDKNKENKKRVTGDKLVAFDYFCPPLAGNRWRSGL